MDPGSFGAVNFDLSFLSAPASIVVIDHILAGDNVVIAMHSSSIPAPRVLKNMPFAGEAVRSLNIRTMAAKVKAASPPRRGRSRSGANCINGSKRSERYTASILCGRPGSIRNRQNSVCGHCMQ
jgi:hypothetical protein